MSESGVTRVLVHVPVAPHGLLSWNLAAWMNQVRSYGHEALWLIDEPAENTRNQQIHDFRSREAEGFDALLMVDSDAVPDMDGFRVLLGAMRRDDVDIVGGWSVMQQGDAGETWPNVFRYDPTSGVFSVDWSLVHGRERGLWELTGTGAVGSHALMISRKAIEAFYDAGEVWFRNEFYEDRDRDGELWGTRKSGYDLRFCRIAAELGLRVWVDTSVFWGHVKGVDLRNLHVARHTPPVKI